MTLRDISFLKRTNWMKNRRKKRGLIDAGGELLKGLFGTATDKEVQVVKKELQAFIGEASAMKNGYQGLLTDVDENHKIIMKIESSLRKIVNTRMEMQTSFILNEITVLLGEVNALISDLMKIYYLVEEVAFHRFKKTLNSRNFPFLTYSTLKEYDQEISNTYGLYSPITLTKDTIDEYLSEAILLGVLKDSNTVRVILPYVEGKPYDVWQFHPFPMKIAKDSARSTMNVIEPYAIISADRQLVITFGEEAFKYCSKPKYKYFACFPILIMKPNNRSECASSILKQNSVARCPLSPFSSEEPVTRWIGDERYLSLSKPQKAVMICEDRRPNEKWLSEVTKVATSCEVKNDELDIPSLQILHKSSAYEFPIINVSAPEIEVISLDEDYEPRKWIDPKWLNITSPRFKFTPRETYKHLTLAMVWIVTICTGVYIFQKRWRRRHRRSKDHQRGQTVENVLYSTTPPNPQQENYYSVVRTPPQPTRRVHFSEVPSEEGSR